MCVTVIQKDGRIILNEADCQSRHAFVHNPYGQTGASDDGAMNGRANQQPGNATADRRRADQWLLLRRHGTASHGHLHGHVTGQFRPPPAAG